MSKFRLEDMINVTFANTEYMRKKKIMDTFYQMQNSIFQAKQMDNKAKQQKEVLLQQVFVGVMEKMKEELLEAKNRYMSLDKEQLKRNKCVHFAEEIRLFREQCFIYKKKLEKGRENLRREKIQEEMLEKEKEALLHNIQKQQYRSKQQKQLFKQSLQGYPKKISNHQSKQPKKYRILKAHSMHKTMDFHQLQPRNPTSPKPQKQQNFSVDNKFQKNSFRMKKSTKNIPITLPIDF